MPDEVGALQPKAQHKHRRHGPCSGLLAHRALLQKEHARTQQCQRAAVDGRQAHLQLCPLIGAQRLFRQQSAQAEQLFQAAA